MKLRVNGLVRAACGTLTLVGGVSVGGRSSAVTVVAQHPDGEPACSNYGPSEPIPEFTADLRTLAVDSLAQVVAELSELAELEDEAALRDSARQLVETGVPVGRPAEWTGYRLIPESAEFWYGSPDRLHRRLRYERTAHYPQAWTCRRLQP